jgi:hypothetical protein
MRNPSVRTAPFFAALSIALGVFGTAPACSDEVRQCRVGADCASGQCAADGTCVPVASGDAATGDGSVNTNDASPDASNVDASPDAGNCGAFDGEITRAELPLGPGLRATYRVATNADVDTAGVAQADGSRVWDFSGNYNGDKSTILETTSPGGTWFDTKFPGATYVAKLAEGSDLLGVFELSPGALALLGVVSPTDGFTRTELTYANKISTLVFPLSMGKTFKTDSTVSGVASGVGSFYSESYDSSVDAKGTVRTPLGNYSVLRVRTTLTRTVGAFVTVVRSFAFVAQCAGVVASVSSNDNESAAEFTRARELRRVAP